MVDDLEGIERTFALIDYLKLMGYGESDSSGAWVKWQIDSDHLPMFRGKKGQLAEITVRWIDEHMDPIPVGEKVKTDPEPSIGGQMFRKLLLSNFFHTNEVLDLIGKDEDYQDWVRSQPSAISGKTPVEYAHVRRANNAGTGIKPPYSGIPLTSIEHHDQHSHGRDGCLNMHTDKTYDEYDAAEWFDKKAAEYRRNWASSRLAGMLGYSSRRLVPPQKLIDWARHSGAFRYLPPELKGA